MAGIVTRTRKRPKQIPYHGEQRTERAVQKRQKYQAWQHERDKWRYRRWSTSRSFGKLVKFWQQYHSVCFVFHETWFHVTRVYTKFVYKRLFYVFWPVMCFGDFPCLVLKISVKSYYIVNVCKTEWLICSSFFRIIMRQ